MPGRAAAFDVVIRGLVLFLVIAAPLALGTVTPWPLALFHWTCVLLGLAWLLRAVWVPPFGGDHSTRPAGALGRWRLFGHPVAATGLGLPVALFIALTILQVLPLPGALIRLVSPATARIQESSVPGLAVRGQADFSSTGSFLLGEREDAVVRRILEAPGPLPEGLSPDPYTARTISLYPYATVSRLVLLLSLCIVFFVSLNIHTSPARIHGLLRLLVLFGFILALFGIVQRLSWNGQIYWTIPVEASASPFGPFVNHNHFAAWIAMLVPIAVGMLMDEARRLIPGGKATPPEGPEPRARLLLAAFTVGVMAAAVVLSGSRGAVLALLGAFVLYGGALVVQGRIGKPETLVAAALIAVAIGLSFWLGAGPLAQKLRAIGDVESEPSLFTRVLGYRATAEIVSHFPVLGTGLGTFPQAWKMVYPAGTSAVWHEAHNDYLQLLSEAGGAGFLIFLAALGIFMKRYVIPEILGRGEVESYAVHGAIVGITAVALHSLVDFPLQIAGCSVLFVVLSATIVAWRQRMEATD